MQWCILWYTRAFSPFCLPRCAAPSPVLRAFGSALNENRAEWHETFVICQKYPRGLCVA